MSAVIVLTLTFQDADAGDESDGAGTSRRKIKIEYITDKARRHITFSKRKAGIMKKVSIYCRQVEQTLTFIGKGV